MPKERASSKIKTLAQLFEVRDSPIHGKGLFAVATIPKGRFIVEYKGRRITREAAAEGYVEGPQTHTFLFELSDGSLIDAAQDGSDARWVNHSCSPNCKTVERKSCIWIRSLRRIRKGEELSYDYNITMAPEERANWPCRCSSKRCRGTLAEV